MMMYSIKDEFLNGCMELKPGVYKDNRGYTIKPYHSEAFNKLGIRHGFMEDLIVASHKHVIRGLHFQNPPFSQAKIIYCLKGSILDIVLDIRAGSPTYGRHHSILLSNEESNILYIPEGFAHGYLSLEEESILIYKMSSIYAPEYEDGIRWDSAGIDWSIKNPVVSERDNSFVPFSEFKSRFTYVNRGTGRENGFGEGRKNQAGDPSKGKRIF